MRILIERVVLGHVIQAECDTDAAPVGSKNQWRATVRTLGGKFCFQCLEPTKDSAEAKATQRLEDMLFGRNS